MNRVARNCIVMVLTAASAGCVTAAPGAEQVKFTSNPADVSACSPVGNISAEAMSPTSPLLAQNLAVGLNANVIFRTGASGVAYRCGNAAVPHQ
jgi:hypothetical protein